MLKLSVFIDSVNNALGRFISYATILMAILMFVIVVLRYGFNLGWIAMQESVTYLHAAVFLLGAAFTYQQDAHVRVDVFYRRFSKRQQSAVNLFGCVFLLLPVTLYISIVSTNYILESWSLLEGSREPGGLPFVYILKSFIWVFSISLCLQAVSEIIKHSIFLLSGNSRDKDESSPAKQQEIR